MKPERALHVMNSLFRYSGRVSRLMAVDNILPKSYLTEVLPLLNTPADMEIFYEVKADLSEQEMAVLAQSGVTQIQPGVEALATSTLKLMKKGTTVFQNLKLLKMCALYGVQPHWNLLVGFPGEGEDVYRRYVEAIPGLVHLYPPSGAYPVRFDRFSPYHYEAEKYSLDLQPLAYYSLIYPFDDADLKKFAYYFADENPQAEYFTTMAKWIGKLRARVAHWPARWNDPGQIPPRLYFKQGSEVVYDSRSGAVIEHQVGRTGKAVLEYLAKPTRIEDLVKVFASLDGPGVLDEIARLEEKNLIFKEQDRVFSLVLDSEHGSQRAKHVAAAVPARGPEVHAAP
jgi:ribosomal peptide maturation radical SAM protein 1